MENAFLFVRSVAISIVSIVAFLAATKAVLTSLLFWILLTHFTLVLDQSLARVSHPWRIGSLILPHSGLLYGLIAFTSRTDLGENALSRRVRSYTIIGRLLEARRMIMQRGSRNANCITGISRASKAQPEPTHRAIGFSHEFRLIFFYLIFPGLVSCTYLSRKLGKWNFPPSES